MAIPLLNYAPASQNSRVTGYTVGSDNTPRIYTTANLLSGSDLDDLIEAAYRQIFFHAFAADREKFLESQLRSSNISVRQFVRGLILSNTYKSSFYDKNSNYRFVEQTVQRVLGRDVYSEKEKIAWSIVVATKGIEGNDLLLVVAKPLIKRGRVLGAVIAGRSVKRTLLPSLQRICGPGVRVIDPAPAVARQVARVCGSLGPDTETGPRGGPAYFTSGAPMAFEMALAKLGIEPGPVAGVVWNDNQIEPT